MKNKKGTDPSSLLLCFMHSFIGSTFCCRDSLLITEDEIKRVTHEICSEDGELAAGIFGREGPPLFYHESVVNDTLLVHEAKDFNQQHLLEVDESFAAEFPYGSPPFNTEKLGIDRYGDAPVTDVIRPSDSPSPIVCELVEGAFGVRFSP